MFFEIRTKLFRIILTIAPTTTEAERSFSLMKLIKNRLRSSLCDEKLSDLMMISLEKERLEKFDFLYFPKRFCAMKKRMIAFF